jgi:predicted dehydrogenase
MPSTKRFDITSPSPVPAIPLFSASNRSNGVNKRVQGFGGQLLPERVQTNGNTFTFTAPDWACALLEFENRVRCRLTASFYTGPTKQHGIEVHGDEGTLHLAHSALFNTPIELRMRGSEEWVPQEARVSESDIDWARGLVDMAHAVRSGVAHQTSAARAAHVVEIASAVHRSLQTGETVELTSRAG